MLSEAFLIQEFTTLSRRTYPQSEELLQRCYIKLVTAYWGQPPQRLDYFAIYYPDVLSEEISAHKAAFTHISRYMGLAEPTCVNVNRLLRDPMSKLKQEAPRFWLELHWLLLPKVP